MDEKILDSLELLHARVQKLELAFPSLPSLPSFKSGPSKGEIKAAEVQEEVDGLQHELGDLMEKVQQQGNTLIMALSIMSQMKESIGQPPIPGYAHPRPLYPQYPNMPPNYPQYPPQDAPDPSAPPYPPQNNMMRF